MAGGTFAGETDMANVSRCILRTCASLAPGAQQRRLEYTMKVITLVVQRKARHASSKTEYSSATIVTGRLNITGCVGTTVCPTAKNAKGFITRSCMTVAETVSGARYSKGTVATRSPADHLKCLVWEAFSVIIEPVPSFMSKENSMTASTAIGSRSGVPSSATGLASSRLTLMNCFSGVSPESVASSATMQVAPHGGSGFFVICALDDVLSRVGPLRPTYIYPER
jgi:hypothetical protein